MVSRSRKLCGLLLEDGSREIFGKYFLCQPQHNHVLDGILQFADIPGPAIVHQ